MEKVIKNILDNSQIIDLNSQLFPYEYQQLCLFGIDNLLTNRNIIIELFETYTGITQEEFNKLTKNNQADIVWQQLFILRTPFSKNTFNILISLKKLGFINEIENRNLKEIRDRLSKINIHNINIYIEQIFNLANIQYTVMTNQVFNVQEVKCLDKIFIFKKGDSVMYKKDKEIEKVTILESHRELGDPGYYTVIYPNKREKNTLWKYLFLPEKSFNELTKRFKTSININQLLFNYQNSLSNGLLKTYGYTEDIEGIKDYIQYWNHFLQPEYFTLYVENDFIYNNEINGKEDTPSYILENIIFPLAEKLNLPILFKFIGNNQKNYIYSLSKMCKKHSKIKFLSNYILDQNYNQIYSILKKYTNLYIYEIFERDNINYRDKIGISSLNISSDSSVLEELLYKSENYKQNISQILIDKYKKLEETGWKVPENEIERDINYLLTGAYHNFMTKKL